MSLEATLCRTFIRSFIIVVVVYFSFLFCPSCVCEFVYYCVWVWWWGSCVWGGVVVGLCEVYVCVGYHVVVIIIIVCRNYSFPFYFFLCLYVFVQ